MTDWAVTAAREALNSGYSMSPQMRAALTKRVAKALRNHPDKARIDKLQAAGVQDFVTILPVRKFDLRAEIDTLPRKAVQL